MPYKRRAPVKKRKFQRKRKAPTNKNLARRVRKLERAPEIKYRDVLSLTPLVSTGAAVGALFIAQGDDFNQRIGEEINLMYINYKVLYVIAAGIARVSFRVMVVLDKQNNGLGPVFLTSTNITEGILDDSVITNPVFSPHNYRTTQRYSILADHLYTSNPMEPTCERSLTFRKNLKFKGMKIKFSSSAGTIADLPSKDIFLLHFGTGVTPYFTSRVWYTDQ